MDTESIKSPSPIYGDQPSAGYARPVETRPALTLADLTSEHHQRLESLENLASSLAQKIDGLQAECAQLRAWVGL